MTTAETNVTVRAAKGRRLGMDQAASDFKAGTG